MSEGCGDACLCTEVASDPENMRARGVLPETVKKKHKEAFETRNHHTCCGAPKDLLLKINRGGSKRQRTALILPTLTTVALLYGAPMVAGWRPRFELSRVTKRNRIEHDKIHLRDGGVNGTTQ